MLPRRLSKSKIMAGLQCQKRLWLQTYRPELAQDNDQTQQAFAAGNEFGEAARRLYPEGQLIEHVFDIPKALAATQAALAEQATTPLFEAAFQSEGVVVRVDLLFREEDGVRQFHLEHFQAVGFALLRRKRLVIDYYARGTGETTHREVSPQRLVYYRGNWYLDVWCHLRNDIRNFSVDAIQHVEISEKKAKDISDKKLDDVLGAGYGIFSGAKVQWATLLFTPELARWISVERWHPNQKSKFNNDGSYELKVPYSKDTELVMDILRQGAGVQVLHPNELRQQVIAEINAMKSTYS